VDNFCWPSIQYHPVNNPDGHLKAAKLVRSCLALKEMCLAYGIPLLSGKDSMYVDGHLPGAYGETHKVSALETLQFSASSIISDITRCVTMDPKASGDLVYVLGATRNELGGSEYYDHFGYVGLNVPLVFPDQFLPMYQALSTAIENRMVASCHGIYSGGLGIHLALMAMAGNLGMTIDLSQLPFEEPLRDDQALFSESAGRFIVTVSADNEQAFESLMLNAETQPSPIDFACIGKTMEDAGCLEIRGQSKDTLLRLSIAELKTAWKKPFGALI
jgi:phosphoribosylformylglycinamidine synthase